MKKYLLTLIMVSTLPLNGSGLKFVVEHPKDEHGTVLEGRVLLFLSKNNTEEPRFQISDKSSTGFVFGIDINSKQSSETIVDNKAFGYPVTSIDQIPPGEYYAQALLHKYETFNLKTGHTVNLPMDRGEGQRWHSAPGNYYSKVKKISLDPTKRKSVKITLDQIIPEINPPIDTKYVKHIKIESKLLSDFWGRPMHLGAHVLLPEGFDDHPESRYPLMIFHGHFPKDFGGFRTSSPDPDLEQDYSERFQLEGYNRIVQEHEYQFYKDWTSKDFPRVVAIEIQHANPYYDDSYAVNSANLGPYGDAITYELIPYIEKQFRCIGEGWSRFLYGGSTGGWEALAAQVFYPDEYNGCYAACPDPIDFRAYCLVNIYKDENAYFSGPKHRKVERPGHRNYLGQVSASLRQMNYRELALGINSRSGEQWDIWQAVYSPMGPDGYPKPIWDKLTGEIDPEVAVYWKEKYDLRYILKRDWHFLGPKLEGKINIYCGDMDNYYLNNAVYLMEDFLESTKDPHYNGQVDYGDRAEHCWNGDHSRPNATSRLRYHQMFIKKAVERINISAPEDADLSSWRY
ncbi:MAG: alpha/beta hydrolase-fold protein [Candidatus Marinimicrobia bacterium]|nr:alpha/beta hydrolase-fold protein [Candidatus Neomarinimicrobiota bacterium]